MRGFQQFARAQAAKVAKVAKGAVGAVVGSLAVAGLAMASPIDLGAPGVVEVIPAGEANNFCSVEPNPCSAAIAGDLAPPPRIIPEYPLRAAPFDGDSSGPADSAAPASPVGPWLENGSSPAFTLATRPREFTFSELLLNPDLDPQCFLPGLGLHVAVAARDLRLLERLLQMGADPNAILSQPVSHSLIPIYDDKTVARYLSKDSGITPLMLATLTKQPVFVRLLLRYGADKERFHTRKYHLYPLDFAALRGDVPMMQLLLGRDTPAEAESRRIVVSLSAQSARLWLGGRSVFVTPISTGKPGYRTPPGEYVVTQKYRVWKSDIYKVPMPNFMRLNCGSFGLHGGYVPDAPASHGCIRLPFGNAAAMFTLVRVGDRVSIVN